MPKIPIADGKIAIADRNIAIRNRNMEVADSNIQSFLEQYRGSGQEHCCRRQQLPHHWRVYWRHHSSFIILFYLCPTDRPVAR
jgi:hypothetical protein